ncbi:MAG: hypothetical protein Q8K99_07000 [Actinomycetota bacterium]|nr:hypothetical protein [Actinomycetota bacterium]
MTQQQASPKPSLARAAIILVLALAAFAAAFYFLDGMSLVEDLLGGSETTNNLIPAKPTETTETATLRLPPGMTEEFALRIWQEQIDSQANILKLVDGQVESMTVSKVTQSGDRATLDIAAQFSDGTSAPGQLGMRSFGGKWYFAYVSGMRRGESGGLADDVGSGAGVEPTSAVPAVADVDVPLVNTILEQQATSSAVLEEYATGAVKSVRVADRVVSAGTVTLDIVMNESHETGYGQIVLISKQFDGETHWFVAKFTKRQASQ